MIIPKPREAPVEVLQISATSKEGAGIKADSKRKDGTHIRGDREFDELPADGYGDPAVQPRVNAVRGFNQPAIQFSLGSLTVFFRIHALPQVFRNRNVSDRVSLGETSE